MFNSFTEAVTAARAGRQDGFSWLYEKTSKEKYYIAIKYMKNQTEAADVLQDAYMKAWQKLDTLDDPEKFPGWVGQIVANTALSALRKNNPLTFSDMSGENDEGEEFVYDIEDESIERQPELNYTTNERQEIIRAMIDSLSDEQRLCVMMFYVEEMSVKEIADTLGCSENTVKSRLNYGRKNIKAEAEELKKKGYNFYSIAPLPLLLLLLRGEKAAAMGGATQAAASAAGTGAAATTAGFFGTVAGKIVLVASIVVAGAGLGFGGYKIMQSVQESGEPVAEAPVSPAAATVEEPTSEPTPEPTPDIPRWEQLYTETRNELKNEGWAELPYSNPDDKDYGYAYIKLDEDETPEMVVHYINSVNTNAVEDWEHIYDGYYYRFYTIRDDKVVQIQREMDWASDAHDPTDDPAEIAAVYNEDMCGEYRDWTGNLEYLEGLRIISGRFEGHTTGIGSGSFFLTFDMEKLSYRIVEPFETDGTQFKKIDFKRNETKADQNKNESASDSSVDTVSEIKWEQAEDQVGAYDTWGAWIRTGSEKDGYYYVKDYKLVVENEKGKRTVITKIPYHHEKGYDGPGARITQCCENYVYVNVCESSDGTGWGNGCILYAVDVDSKTIKKISGRKCDVILAHDKYMVIEKSECEPTDAGPMDSYLYVVNGQDLKEIKRLGLVFGCRIYKEKLIFCVYPNYRMKKVIVYSSNPDGSEVKKLFTKKDRSGNEWGSLYVNLYDMDKNGGKILINEKVVYRVKD